MIEELGKGSYGTVYKVRSLLNDEIYVLKKINMKHLKLKHQKEAYKEAMILKQLDHPSIIKYYTSFVEKDVLHIVMEFADGGDL